MSPPADRAPEKKKKGKRIVYIGNDTAYWQTIQNRFKSTYIGMEFEFSRFTAVDRSTCQNVMRDTVLMHPEIVYVDLSFARDWQLKLAHFLRRENSTRKIPLVGLVESKDMLKHCAGTGMTFTHLKCGEYHDVVFDPMALAFPKEAKSAQFAKAKMSQETQMVEDFLVAYYTATSMHVEGNLKLEKGAKVQITHAVPPKVFSSEKFIVKDVGTTNLYYDYKYSYDLEYVYVDEPVLAPERAADAEAQKEHKQAMANFKLELEKAKKKTKEWVSQNSNGHELKQTKILAVDPELAFMAEGGMSLQDCAYPVRAQSILSEDLDEIPRIMPHIIAYQFQEGAPEIENPRFEQLKAIVTRSKAISNYAPFLLIFNTKKYASKFLQDKLGHQQLMAQGQSMTMELLNNMANIFEEKLVKSEASKKRGLQFFPDKKSPLANAHINYDISILAMSESELTIMTPAELQITAYRMGYPTPMSVTVVPADGKLFVQDRGQFIYRALLHAIGEDDKKSLRQYVNTIFCAPNVEKREKDAESFEKKNQEVLQKRLEEEAKAAAEAEAEEKDKKTGS